VLHDCPGALHVAAQSLAGTHTEPPPLTAAQQPLVHSLLTLQTA
jgi:hypothetical protein